MPIPDETDDFDDLGPPPPTPASRARGRIFANVFIVAAALAILIFLAVLYSRIDDLLVKVRG